MILLERNESFLMVTQQDHAKLSGEIASNWKRNYFAGFERKDDVIQAIYEHDRCWIELDKKPLWNEEKQQPYSFTDYPAKPKLDAYTRGIDEVSKLSTYAALLCSLHYTSFLEDSTDSLAISFCEQERVRQRLIFKQLGKVGNKKFLQEVDEHVKLLKFCDNLSLYLCLNEPGGPKANEHPFFRNGFPQRFWFYREKIHAHWQTKETVTLTFLPFSQNLQLTLPYKNVNKNQIHIDGLAKAYADTPLSYRELEIK
ncbi:DUF3891 family protein [Mesobacillus maritimus]|uniref:DUF3891 family protein n=1 Tax=Mesobacillus maritimus TaxID=1643336 RepID=UPI002040F791|nr:DUF3891 family protein [Mesobacillus maritimus]MCM3585885.1 DUF3891 family protein [Mesobacillus maritimus]